MGVYAGSERIDSVNVGSKDMVVVMQDNHILALGEKYWAIKLSDYTWTKYQRDIEPFIYTDQVPLNYVANSIVYCSNRAKLIDISGERTTRIYFPNYTNLNNVDLDVWLIYEFNQTLYAKVDLGSLSYNYNSTSKCFTTTSLSAVIKPSATTGTKANIYSFVYATQTSYNIQNTQGNMEIAVNNSSTPTLFIKNLDYNEIEVFVNANKGKTLLYEVVE